jgi:hypothetical protein
MSACPKCSTEIGSAEYCGCGWRRVANPGAKLAYPDDPPRVHCAHDSCPHNAVVKIETKYGWANLCWRHHEEHFKRQAQITFEEMGLKRWPDESRDDHVKRVREYTKLIVRRMPMEKAA